MNWWDDLVGKREYPSFPKGDEDEIDRAGTAGTLMFFSFILFAASVLFGLFSQNWSAAFWGIMASLAGCLLAGWLMPEDKPKRR